MDDLDPKQELFTDEFLVDLNQTQAYIRAGYAVKGSSQNAARLMANDKVQARIREKMAARADRLELSQDRVVAEIAKVAFASMRNFISVDEEGQPRINLTDTSNDALDSLSEISTETVLEGDPERPDLVRKTKIKLLSKLDALDKLMQHLGGYEKQDRNRANALADAMQEIWSRGSKAPIRDTAPLVDGARPR